MATFTWRTNPSSEYGLDFVCTRCNEVVERTDGAMLDHAAACAGKKPTSIPRGDAQVAALGALLAGGDYHPTRDLRGSAWNYGTRYQASFDELRYRAAAHGIRIEAVPVGPRGGKRYMVTAYPLAGMTEAVTRVKERAWDGDYYKAVAVTEDGYRSIYDGTTEYAIGVTTEDTPRLGHAGGIYVYRTEAQARCADVPNNSALRTATRRVLRVRAEGPYVWYPSGKIAFARVTPLEEVA